MRNLIIMSIISIAVVTAITLWAAHVITDVQGKEKEIQEQHDKVVLMLKETNETFGPRPEQGLVAERFAIFLKVRDKVALEIRQRTTEKSKNAFHARETRIAVLERLYAELVAAKMSVREYNAISVRWRSLLAKHGPPHLKKSWDRETRTREHLRGMPLPKPPTAERPEEAQLVSKNAEALEQSMPAGLLTPVVKDLAHN